MTQLAESLRAQLSRLSTFQVQSEACIYLQNVLATVLVSSDQLLFKRAEDSLDEYPSQVKLVNYACSLNSGVLTGEPLQTVPMIAYLNSHQNQLLEMTDISHATVDTGHIGDGLMPNSPESVQRYEAQIEDYYSYKQEFTSKHGGQQVHFKLPIF